MDVILSGIEARDTSNENVVVTLLLALFVPWLSKALFRFAYRTLPNAIHRVVTGTLLRREVVAVKHETLPGADVTRLVQSGLLIEMIIGYVGELGARAAEREEARRRRHRSAGAAEGEQAEGEAAEDGDDDFFLPRTWEAPEARLCYVATPAAAALRQTGVVREGESPAGRRATREYTERMLREGYRPVLLPSADGSFEVEPGLFLSYTSTAKTVGDVEEERRQRRRAARLMQRLANAQISPQEYQQTARAVAARRGLAWSAAARQKYADDFIYADLLRPLTEAETTEDRDDPEEVAEQLAAGRRGVLGAVLAGTLRGPFDGSDDGDGEDESDEDESDADSEEGYEREAAMRRTAVPQQIVLRTRHLAAGREEEAYRRHHAAAGGAAEGLAAATDPRTRIDAFVRRAMTWYAGQLLQHTGAGKRRFLIYPAQSEAVASLQKKMNDGGDDDDDDDEGKYDCVARRYLIPKEDEGGKTFRTLFFRDKARLLRLVRDYMNGTGKFAVRGTARRLVLLLHGPPGTGKTSLVKAIAAEMRRHIVVLPLTAIHTRTALSTWMHDARAKCAGETAFDFYGDSECAEDYNEEDYYEARTKVVRLRCKDVVYLLEDVDAVPLEGLRLDEAEGGAEEAEEEREEEEEEREEEEEEEEEEDDDDDDEDDGSPEAKAKKEARMMRLMAAIMKEINKDRLTVEGLVQALTSVAAAEQVVVLTTNHPERLDPRLLAPTVLTARVEMGDIDGAAAVDMVRHYHRQTGGLAPADAARLADAVAAMSLSPARLEQLCAECDSAADVVAAVVSGKHKQTEITF